MVSHCKWLNRVRKLDSAELAASTNATAPTSCPEAARFLRICDQQTPSKSPISRQQRMDCNKTLCQPNPHANRMLLPCTSATAVYSMAGVCTRNPSTYATEVASSKPIWSTAWEDVALTLVHRHPRDSHVSNDSRMLSCTAVATRHSSRCEQWC